MTSNALSELPASNANGKQHLVGPFPKPVKTSGNSMEIENLVQGMSDVNLISPSSQPSQSDADNAKAAQQERILQQKELNKIFVDSMQEQMKNVPQIEMPVLLKVKLYDYQKDGVRWLVHRENDTESVPPFWKQRKYGSQLKWYCSIVNQAQDMKPAPVRGSILADEMGLGKTYQSLALMLANPPKGVTYPIQCPPKVPRCTIIVCPVAVMSNWIQEIKTAVNDNQTKPALSVATWEGAKRERQLGSLLSNRIDILLVSYETLGSDYKNHKKNKEDGIYTIFDILFHRIILDEAHKIRNKNTTLFKGVNHLHAKRKLCLTGTPFNNHPNDIQALLSFLRMYPLSEKHIFDHCITSEIMNKKELGLARLRTMMAHIALRRTKDSLKLPLSIPDKTVIVREVDFGRGINSNVYNALYTFSRALVLDLANEVAENKEGGMRHVPSIFALVHYLRVACCHVGLVRPKLIDCVKSLSSNIEDGRFVGKTVDEVAALLSTAKIDKDDESVNKTVPGGTSPKTNALLKAIAELKADEKGVVFSEWTSFLDIIEVQLTKARVFFTRIDGTMPRAERDAALAKFNTQGTKSKDEPRILLCSLRACGVGINLCRASHVFMMDPFWNQAAEEQAVDRVHRHGQTRPVHVVRFIMEDSIEERMMNVQEAKAALGKGVIEMLGAEEKRAARVTALRDLFEVTDTEQHEWDESFIADDDDMDFY